MLLLYYLISGSVFAQLFGRSCQEVMAQTQRKAHSAIIPSIEQINPLEISETLTGLSIVEFYQPKCPHCIELMPIMIEVEDYIKKNPERYPNLSVKQCSCEKARLCRALGLKNVPTLRLYQNTQKVSEFSSESKSFEGIMAWIDASIAMMSSVANSAPPSKLRVLPSVVPSDMIIH